MRKICVVTTDRADYGYIEFLMKSIHEDPKLKLQLIVTGSHFVRESVNMIDFKIDKEVYLYKQIPNTDKECIECMSTVLRKFPKVYKDLKPDLVVILGDRYEMYACALSAFFMNIPIAHIGGGDITEGVLDDTWRDCITIISSIHFTYTEQSKKRVIQMLKRRQW